MRKTKRTLRMIRSIGPRGGYTAPTPNDYDGTNDYQTRGADLTGVADGKVGTFALSTRIDGGDGGVRFWLRQGNGRFIIYASAGNKILVEGFNAAGVRILRLQSTSTFTAGATWLNINASWDLAAAAGHLFVNGTDEEDAAQTLITNDTIDYAGSSDWGLMATATGTLKMPGCLSVFWADFATYYDLSSAANRAKFYDAANKPVDLGADGTNPGSTPILYTDDGDLTDNKGTGGNFTTTGALAACSSSPSD